MSNIATLISELLVQHTMAYFVSLFMTSRIEHRIPLSAVTIIALYLLERQSKVADPYVTLAAR